MSDAQRSALVRGLWLALGLLAAVLCVHDLGSLDYWWHLRAGRLIAETGAVPRVDPFTYTAPGARWIDIHWLFQLLTHQLHALGGHTAVALSQLALVGLLLAALAPIGARRERAWLGLLALALALLLLGPRLQARPEVASFALLAWVLRLLDRFEREPDLWVYAIVPLQLIWVNVHGLFAVGIAVCAIHLFAELVRGLAGGRAGGLQWPRLRRLAGVTLLATLVSLANPNGFLGALYPVQQLEMIGPPESRGAFGMQVDELQPTLASSAPLTLALFLGLAAFTLAALALNFRRVREVDLLLFVAFLYLGLGANRNTALFAVAAAPILVRNANEAIDARPRLARLCAGAVPFAAALALLLVVDVALARRTARLGRFSWSGVGVVEGLNPLGAVEWIARTQAPAPIAHGMADGGYLIWRLWPEYSAMSDGRLEVFGPELLLRLQPADPERFAELDRRYRFGSVLLNHRNLVLGPLLRALHASPDWRLAYADDVSAVFVRSGADASRWPALDLDRPDAFAPLEGVAPSQARDRLAARVQLLLDLGRTDLALRAFETALDAGVEVPDAPALRAELRALAAGTALPEELPAGGVLAPAPR